MTHHTPGPWTTDQKAEGHDRLACHPGRLWSLLGLYMRAIKIDALLTKCRQLVNTMQMVQGIDDPFKRDLFLNTLQDQLRECKSICADIGLTVSGLHVDDTLTYLTFRGSNGVRVAALEPTAIDRGVQSVVNNIEKELSLRTFYTIALDKADYLQAFTPDSGNNPVESKWEPIFKAFPSTSFDAKEAFKCFALGRNTACVFHLMRVLELGLKPLGAIFEVSLEHTNWQPAIGAIEKEIRKMPADQKWKILPDCKEQHEFFSQAASNFSVLKDAWRNYTAHARGKYDEQEASDILMSVRAFMAKLSNRFTE